MILVKVMIVTCHLKINKEANCSRTESYYSECHMVKAITEGLVFVEENK